MDTITTILSIFCFSAAGATAALLTTNYLQMRKERNNDKLCFRTFLGDSFRVIHSFTGDTGLEPGTYTLSGIDFVLEVGEETHILTGHSDDLNDTNLLLFLLAEYPDPITERVRELRKSVIRIVNGE